ncbi:DUF3173 family protein [Lactococcus lactis]
MTDDRARGNLVPVFLGLEVEYMIILVDKNDLMQLTGYSKTQSQNLIRRAKEKLVLEGLDWYKNKAIGRVPILAVEEILGYPIRNDTIEDVEKVG